MVKEKLAQEEEVQEVNPLEAMLGTSKDIEKQVYIKRLNTHFTVKRVDEEFDDIKAEVTYYTGKGKKRTKELDEDKFNLALIAEGCVNPNFKDKRVLEHYGVQKATDAVRKALLVGEQLELVQEILDASGFDNEVEEAKN
ncbi:phage tail assembly chaperone [Metabacillus fastidiosus]|uniref:Phage XkdN-like protein n=1 Tax=Metabacillus fastidiosus TaxID=1458 RepID=A0ABU6NRJ4_9BACI|nr:hypothetical protein [Metabacillus fastidiosus]